LASLGRGGASPAGTQGSSSHRQSSATTYSASATGAGFSRTPRPQRERVRAPRPHRSLTPVAVGNAHLGRSGTKGPEWGRASTPPLGTRGPRTVELAGYLKSGRGMTPRLEPAQPHLQANGAREATRGLTTQDAPEVPQEKVACEQLPSLRVAPGLAQLHQRRQLHLAFADRGMEHLK
jgi:hypothetical protein